jgi:tRNA (guanine-N7-)-methyltransferase
VSVQDIAYVVQPSQWTPPLDPDALFERPGSMEVELGSGKGLFLEQAVRLEPGKNFLGVERADKFFRHAVRRFLEAPPPNLRLFRADAFDVLTRWIAPETLAGVHVYFPDPWPKARHAGRRLLRPQLYQLVFCALEPGALLRIASDVEPYFRTATRDILSSGLFEPMPWPEDSPDRLATNYALKYARERRSLHYAKFLRRATPVPGC